MSVRVRLVPPVIWQRAVREWFAPLTEAERPLAAAILSALQNQHVGITPRLAASLTRTLSEDRSATVWDAALDRIGRALGSERLLLQPERAFDFMVFELGRALLMAACEVLEFCFLFAEDALDAEVTAQQWTDYDAGLLFALRSLLDGDDLPALFWREQALRLATSAAFAPQPDFSLIDATILLEMRPQMRDRREDALQLVLPQAQHLRDERRQSAGADGLMLTRREEDIQRMHLTEYLYPEMLRMDRALNTGFTIIKPPPQPVQQQDLLVLAMAASGVAEVFLQTCFADFALSITRSVRRDGAAQIRWIDADRYGRTRTLHALVRDLSPLLPVEIAPDALPDHRQLFLQSAGWLPAYLDRAAPRQPLATIPQETVPQPLEWLRAVWNLHTDPLQPSPADAPKIDLNGYPFVFALVLLPATMLESEPADELDRSVRDALGSSPAGLSITLVPDERRDFEHWSAHSAHGYWAPAADTASLAQLAGGLIDCWLDTFFAEMRHV